MTKLTFSQFSGLRFHACDDLCGNMAASEYGEFYLLADVARDYASECGLTGRVRLETGTLT